MPKIDFLWYDIERFEYTITESEAIILKRVEEGCYIVLSRYIKLDCARDNHIFYFLYKDGTVGYIDFGTKERYKDFIRRYSPIREVYIKPIREIVNGKIPTMWRCDDLDRFTELIKEKDSEIDIEDIEIEI